MYCQGGSMFCDTIAATTIWPAQCTVSSLGGRKLRPLDSAGSGSYCQARPKYAIKQVTRVAAQAALSPPREQCEP